MITILTPTYNRAYILSKAYESLKKQTCKDFEWLIIDDGSTDYPQEVIKGAITSVNLYSLSFVSFVIKFGFL